MKVLENLRFSEFKEMNDREMKLTFGGSGVQQVTCSLSCGYDEYGNPITISESCYGECESISATEEHCVDTFSRRVIVRIRCFTSSGSI